MKDKTIKYIDGFYYIKTVEFKVREKFCYKDINHMAGDYVAVKVEKYKGIIIKNKVFRQS